MIPPGEGSSPLPVPPSHLTPAWAEGHGPFPLPALDKLIPVAATVPVFPVFPVAPMFPVFPGFPG
jgi:hypothetical protein